MSAMLKNERAWYREPMVWMLIALPSIVIAASIITIVLAVKSGGGDVYPSMVKRTAQVQVEDLAADRTAIAMKLSGMFRIDAATGSVRVELAGVPAEVNTLHLDLIHPAQASADMSADLVRAGETFVGRIDNAAGKVWSVELRDAQGNWRIAGRLDPQTNATTLAPALSEGG